MPLHVHLGLRARALQPRCVATGKQGDDTCAGTISVFEVLPDDVRDGDYEVTVRSPSNAAPKARELMRTKGPAALKAKLTEFLAALTKRDGDERALAEDKVRGARGLCVLCVLCVPWAVGCWPWTVAPCWYLVRATAAVAPHDHAAA